MRVDGDVERVVDHDHARHVRHGKRIGDVHRGRERRRRAKRHVGDRGRNPDGDASGSATAAVHRRDFAGQSERRRKRRHRINDSYRVRGDVFVECNRERAVDHGHERRIGYG